MVLLVTEPQGDGAPLEWFEDAPESRLQKESKRIMTVSSSKTKRAPAKGKTVVAGTVPVAARGTTNTQGGPAVTPVTPGPAPGGPTAPGSSGASSSASVSAIEAGATQLMAALDAFEALLGAAPALTPLEKRHAAKLRKGGEVIVSQLGALAVQNGLESSTLQVAPMSNAMAQAQALTPVIARIATFQQNVTDVVFTKESSAWVTALQFYALLKHRARTNTQLKAALQPVVASFAYRNPATKPATTLTKPQRKATAKAVKTLQEHAPTQLASASGSKSANGSSGATANTASPSTPSTAH